MIEVERLSKRFGPVTALDDLSFTVRPGRVTGFLGRTARARPPRCGSFSG
jgi:ABC-2 type transport system ATP-binding protein